MRSYPLAEARASLSQLVDRALAGEPQRVTRRGREAVMIVSERDWQAREDASTDAQPWAPRETYGSLGELLADFVEGSGFRESDFDRTWTEAEAGIGQSDH